MIQGMNCTIAVYRKVPGTDDAVGGAVSTETLVKNRILARLSPNMPSRESREMGIEIPKLYSAKVWPATVDIVEDDYVVAESGPHEGKKFLVKGVQFGSLLHSDSRAHKSLSLERIDYARASP